MTVMLHSLLRAQSAPPVESGLAIRTAVCLYKIRKPDGATE